MACIIYVELAINLLNGFDKNKSYENAKKFINKSKGQIYKSELIYFERLINHDISKYAEGDISSTGYVIDSLEASLWSFLTENNYQKIILKAINLGGDTDTIAALAGGLAGIYYGLDAIPENWIQCLARKRDINYLLISFRDAII